MAIGDGRTVWVLGAGFSKSLGGPLLVDLFRQKVFEDLSKTIGEARAAKVTWTQALFNVGLGSHWADAEDFLAYAEGALGDPRQEAKQHFLEGLLHRREFVHRLWPGADQRFRECWDDPLGAILHAFATETVEFLRGNATDQEQWRPYLEWARSLDPARDSVITFNYDPVLDALDSALSAAGQEKLQIILPGEAVRPDRVQVFKLHGSAHWVKTPIRTVEWDPGAVDKGRSPLIAAPGRSKAHLTSSLLKPLWTEAHRRLQRAEDVVIVGYGFPKTDAEARATVLGALDDDQSGVGLRRAHLVLGPDLNLSAHRRVLELVRPRLGTRRKKFVNGVPAVYRRYDVRLGVVIQYPLYAEDFIGDYGSRTRDDVFAD
jgi:hypothetical protein